MAKIHYDELTVGVPSKASSVNYENADGTKESVQSKISKILQTEEDTQDDVEGIKQNIADLIPIAQSFSLNGVELTAVKSGYVVTLSLLNGSVTASANQVFLTLPTKYAPKERVDFLDSYDKNRLHINTNGAMSCTKALTNALLRGSVTYICASNEK